MIRILLLSVLMLLFAPASIACNRINVSVETVSSDQYDPGAVIPQRPGFILRTLDADPNEACADAAIFIRPSLGELFPLKLRGHSATLEMNASALLSVVRYGNVLQLTPDARHRLLAGEPVRVELGDFRPGQFIEAGRYTAALELVVDEQITPFLLEMSVLPVVRFELSSTTTTHNLNLGDPTRGAHGAARFFYRSNSDMRVSIVSENQGRLIHVDGEAIGSIVYQAAFAGRELNLATGREDVNVPFSGVGVQMRELAVSVPATGIIAAGRYRDVLSISFTPF